MFVTMRTTLMLGIAIIVFLTIIGLVIATGYAKAPAHKGSYDITPEQWFWMKAKFVRSFIAVICHVGLIVWSLTHHDKWFVVLMESIVILIWIIISYVEMYGLGTDDSRVRERE